MFEMIPAMGLGKRLAVWWSCAWRQMLVTLPLWLVFIVFLVVWAWTLHDSLNRYVLVRQLGIALVLMIPVLLVICLPIMGFTVRSGFAAHLLPAPSELSIGQAIMVGLATRGWSMLASLPAGLLSVPLRHMGHPVMGGLLNMAIQILVAVYIVLPRQARRLRLLADCPS